MPEMGAELAMPTEQEIFEANKKEPKKTLFQKVSSRLMESGRIGVLSALLITTAAVCERETDNSPTTPEPAITRTIEATPDYNLTETPQNYSEELANVKQRVENSQSEQKDTTIEVLNHFESIYKSTDDLKKAYEAEKTGSEPTLLVQVKQKFNQIDFSSLWQDEYENENEFYKDQIFFLHDHKILQDTLDDLERADSNIEIEDTIAKSYLNLTVSESIYSKMGKETESSWQFSEEIPNEIKSEFANIKPLSKVTVRFATPDEISNLNLRGAIFSAATSEIIISPSAPAETAIHEAGHATDIIENPNILKYSSAEKVIKLVEARNKVILETRQYNDFNKIQSEAITTATQKRNKNEPLTEDESNAIISYLANRILTDPSGDRGTNITENIFAQKLQSRKLEELKTQNNTYLTNSEFLKAQSQNLDEISRENPFLKVAIEEIKANPQLFENYYGGINQTPLPGFAGRPQSKYFDNIQNEFAPQILFSKLNENDPELLKLIPAQELPVLLQKVIDQNRILERELIAEGFKFAVSSNDNQAFENYLKSIDSASD